MKTPTKCFVCDKRRQPGGCTNRLCATCHRLYCTDGGNDGPGHCLTGKAAELWGEGK